MLYNLSTFQQLDKYMLAIEREKKPNKTTKN